MRRFSRWLAVALAALMLACTPTKLVGEVLPGAIAPDFTLTDGPTGQVVSLSMLRGSVVLLTFLYTRCPDVCPLTAELIRNARDRMGSSAKDVAFVAVSVDPVGDTPATTRQFVQAHQLESNLRYLIGSQAALSRVWQAYGIAQGVSTSEVFHSDAIYLIDRTARGRVLLHSDVSPDTLATDLGILVRER
ncbi:MAG: SCO family protein [Chloroflexi bacterium]|nr:MAG: SCO family protein [Chloroflexota bacterium]